ncbi:protease/lipase ABC transporter permease/ATP-binding protein [Roseateles aquatilis]|uniref:Cyclolysin secretion/processing ATP-binding protein CyaB n=1 Tax=Roseateles aquatilis TaxID=431061 RepID=A0A246JKH2_9BURK|nr:type I secretion system permease/ATPase [Roseateles aquatilis]OWQ93085.1 protease/lipase ABC transporter permease/ATP-binding protein [Roseateles aquatilis]
MDRPHDPFFDGDQRARRPGLRLAAEDGHRAPGMPDEPVDPLADLAQQPAIDPLLQCLAWLTQHHGRARSADSLRAGAPVEGVLSPDQGIRLMREAGYNAGLLRKGIDEIHQLLLPAVLLLNGGDACVLVRRLDDAPEGGARYEVVFPGPESASCVAPASELDQEYSGFILAVTPQEKSQAKPISGPGETPLLQPDSHWLFGTLRRFMPYYRSAMLAALLSNVLMMVSGLVTSVIYDKVIPHQAFVTLWTLAVGAGLALIFDLFARQLRSHLIDLAGRKTDLIVGAKLFRQTLGVRMEHRPASAGSYAHYLAQVEVVRDFFTSATMSVLTDLPFVVLFVVMTFVIGGPLGWVLVLAIPLMLLMSFGIQGYLRRAMRTNLTEAADLHGTLVEALEGLEDLKTTGAEGRFLRRYEHSTAIVAESALRARTMASWSMNISMSMQQIINLVMLVWGVYLIQESVITAGALIGAVMFAGRATVPLNSLVSLATRYQGARAAMLSLNSVMSAPVERDSTRNYVPLNQITGRIGLVDVGFSYPAQGDAQSPKVLRNVTLRIQPGERVAILGRIGSGKSTVLRMLAGLYQPTEGMVDVDGIDLRQVDPAEFRGKVGFVSQEPRLFHGTLRDNVLMGRHVDAQRLVEVAKLTGLDRVVAGHPMGWDLPVGEMGSLLSGGQRQLVALARSLVTKPQILLMDEPTSSMDAQSEIAFLRQLRDAAGTCTLIMVTHRPAVLELVSRIVVVDTGRLVMDGPRDQVLAALSGVRPGAPGAQPGQQPQAAPAQGANLHVHPAAQAVNRAASV